MGHEWMSPVCSLQWIYEWVTYECGISASCSGTASCSGCRGGCLMNESRMSHEWMSHVNPMNKSCHTYEWVMSEFERGLGWVMRMSVSHVTEMNGSCHTCKRVKWHSRMRHATHMNVTCHTHGLVMCHVWMSRVTHMDESCHSYENMFLLLAENAGSCHSCKWAMSHVWMSHVTLMNKSCHSYENVSFECIQFAFE